MSRLVPQAMLQQQGVSLDDLEGFRFLKGHKNVAMAVLSGDADAGAVKEEIYRQFKNNGIRSLAQSPDISEHLFVTRSNLDPLVIDKLKKLMLGLAEPEKIINVLKPIKKSLTGLVSANDADYDSLRELMQLVK